MTLARKSGLGEHPALGVHRCPDWAGQSLRMNGENKLTKEIDGIPLIKYAVKNILGSSVNEIIIVIKIVIKFVHSYPLWGGLTYLKQQTVLDSFGPGWANSFGSCWAHLGPGPCWDHSFGPC